MVFFTCNHCGESVKKPAVEKHYNTKCRGAMKNVSCMDCLKDFRGEEYVAHTKCITEAQKYSGKDYVHKEAKNSGEKKQESWMTIVRAILDSTDYKLSEQSRSAFQMLQSVDNVPRKKVKFQNFTKNCMRMPMRLSEEVWKVLEKELEKMKSTSQQENVGPNADIEDRTSQNEVKHETSALNGEGSVRKKSKKDNTSNGEVIENVVKKKSKKNKANGAKNANNEEGTYQNESKRAAPENNEHEESAKKKSKKDKNPNIDGDVKSAENVILTKQKSNKSKANEVEVPIVADTNGNDEPPKKKSKKSKTEAQEVILVNELPTNAALAANDSEEFEWNAVIEKIVQKSKEGIAVEKLKARVLKKYVSKLGVEELTEKQQKKFEKKFSKNFKKSSSVQVEGEIVKAC